ncbi:hypothetical protein KJ068_00380 [bacterium]|nr:hypothetical protein [bacterium]
MKVHSRRPEVGGKTGIMKLIDLISHYPFKNPCLFGKKNSPFLCLQVWVKLLTLAILERRWKTRRRTAVAVLILLDSCG